MGEDFAQIMAHRFFLSYSSKNSSPPLQRFYDDLAKYVRDRHGGDITEIAFRDRITMKAGTEWEPALFEALKASQALVYLLSVDYLQSDNCGKELQAFRFRLAEYRRLAREKLRTAGATADHAKAQVDLQTPLVIQPVIWIPLSVSGLPPALRMLQADDDAFPKTYATQGLESLAKQRDKTAYRRCVDIIGNRVLQAAHGDPLPMLPGYSAYAEIPSAFASVKTVEPPAHQALPQSIPSGPTPLTCVYVAASDEEIRRYNAAAGDSSRADLSCYGSGGWFWRPFHPSVPITVGQIVQPMITEYPYDWRAISDDHNDLIKQLQDAARTGQIVLLIVDAWTAPLQRYHDFLQAFDTSVPFNHAVLVPWNEDDEQTQACRDRLKAQLHLLFRSKYPGGQASPRFRSDIRSVEEFRSALLSALEMIRSEIETHRAAQLQIQGQPIAQIRTAREQPNAS